MKVQYGGDYGITLTSNADSIDNRIIFPGSEMNKGHDETFRVTISSTVASRFGFRVYVQDPNKLMLNFGYPETGVVSPRNVVNYKIFRYGN